MGGGQRGAAAEAGAGLSEGRRRGAAGRGRQRRARGAGAQGGLRAHGEAGDGAAVAVGRSKRRASARRVGRRGQSSAGEAGPRTRESDERELERTRSGSGAVEARTASEPRWCGPGQRGKEGGSSQRCVGQWQRLPRRRTGTRALPEMRRRSDEVAFRRGRLRAAAGVGVGDEAVRRRRGRGGGGDDRAAPLRWRQRWGDSKWGRGAVDRDRAGEGDGDRAEEWGGIVPIHRSRLDREGEEEWRRGGSGVPVV